MEFPISPRAAAIARGLLRTNRAIGVISQKFGMLRLKCRSGGYYWISLNGDRVHRGKTLSKADKLQPKLIDLMERTGR